MTNFALPLPQNMRDHSAASFGRTESRRTTKRPEVSGPVSHGRACVCTNRSPFDSGLTH